MNHILAVFKEFYFICRSLFREEMIMFQYLRNLKKTVVKDNDDIVAEEIRNNLNNITVIKDKTDDFI
jgi:hypothetical protein